MKAIALAVLALAPAGCAEGSDTRLSEREFSERTNAMCVELAASDDWPTTFSPYDFSPREWRMHLKAVRVFLRRLRTLRPPVALERDWTSFLTAAERLIDADGALYAVSPRPATGSNQQRRAERRANAAERALERAAAVLPVGIACRTG